MTETRQKMTRYPRSRLATLDVGRIGGRKHHVAALVEIDVTEGRQRIRAALKRGERVGTLAWTASCIAEAVRRHPEVAAINGRRRQQAVFEEVDIAMPLERTVDGRKVPLTMLIRRADAKSVSDIQLEINAAIRSSVENSGDYVLAERRIRPAERIFYFMPGFLRRTVWRILMRSPYTVKANMGTVMLTNIGLTGRSSGWILPKGLHNLCFAMGTITKKPRVVGREILPRDVMNLTVLFDHDAVDGAPAARFVETLVVMMENGTGLPDED